MNQLKKIQYNCRHATFLIEKKQLQKLTLRENVELRIHLAGCSVCRIFQQQSVVINQMVRSVFKDDETSSPLKLDDTFKKVLQERIDSEMKK